MSEARIFAPSVELGAFLEALAEPGSYSAVARRRERVWRALDRATAAMGGGDGLVRLRRAVGVAADLYAARQLAPSEGLREHWSVALVAVECILEEEFAALSRAHRAAAS